MALIVPEAGVPMILSHTCPTCGGYADVWQGAYRGAVLRITICPVCTGNLPWSELLPSVPATTVNAPD